MLSGSLFSHHQGRFQPSQSVENHFINVSSSSSVKTKEHLAADVDARTPTLRRYAKFNMSANFAHRSELPMIKIELLDDDRKNNGSRHHRQEPSKKFDVSNGVNTRSPRQNWLLLDKGVELRSASVNRGSTGGGGATSFSWLWMDDHSKKKSRPFSESNGNNSLRSRHLTLGNLKLFKSNIGSSKSTKSPTNICDQHCCECAKPGGISKTVAPITRTRPTILPQAEIMHDESPKSIQRNYDANSQSAYLPRSPTSTSSSSKSSNNSCQNDNADKCHLSCPDLLEPCLNREGSSDSLLSSTLSRNRRKKSEKKSGKNKQLCLWNLDDVLQWLQSIGLEDVTSVLIGYDISGADLENWNHTTLISFGISDEAKRNLILSELQKLKSSNGQHSPRVQKKNSSQRCYSLFPLINESKYNVILTMELPITTTVRDFTVATDPLEWALIVTSCKSNLPLAKGDLIIELNGISCIKLPPVDFNKILHDLSGHKYQLVILRKMELCMHQNEQIVNLRL